MNQTEKLSVIFFSLLLPSWNSGKYSDAYFIQHFLENDFDFHVFTPQFVLL